MKKNIIKIIFTVFLLSNTLLLSSCAIYLNSIAYTDTTEKTVDTSNTTFIVNTTKPTSSSLNGWKICRFNKSNDKFTFSKELEPGLYYIYLCDYSYSSYSNDNLTGTKVSSYLTLSDGTDDFMMSNDDAVYFIVYNKKEYTITLAEQAYSYNSTGYAAFYIQKETVEDYTVTNSTQPSFDKNDYKIVTFDGSENNYIYYYWLEKGTYSVQFSTSSEKSSYVSGANSIKADIKVYDMKDSDSYFLSSYNGYVSNNANFTLTGKTLVAIKVTPYSSYSSGKCGFRFYKN